MSIAEILADASAPVEKRYNALFEARSYLSAEETVEAISGLLKSATPSILLRHEACYVLGQTGCQDAIPVLREIVASEAEHEITRHEAVEALGALGDCDCADLLEMVNAKAKPEEIPLRETCELALKRIRETSADAKTDKKSDFNTVDPVAMTAESLADLTEANIEELKNKMLSLDTALADKYSALFALRSIKDKTTGESSIEACKAIAYVMRHENTSALFRHELAFVIAQLAFGKPDVDLVDLVASCFQNSHEHCMVRHEAAVALGSIGGLRSKEVLSDFVQKHKLDEQNLEETIVFESCLVALESLKYWDALECKSA
jgi:deoxyhypusine monooxygenase